MVTQIDSEKGFIFLHIPKCGGTSINDAIIRNECCTGNSMEDLRKHLDFTNRIASSHSNIKQLGLTQSESDKYEIFSVVRNPFTKTVSTYNHFIQSPENQAQREPWTTESYTFKQYLNNIQQYFKGKLVVSLPDENGEGNFLYRAFTPENLYNAQHFQQDLKFLLDVRHIEKLSWWLTTTDGGAANCKLLRFENLHEDWENYKEKINVKTSIEHLNKNVLTGVGADSPQDYMSNYDEESYQIIEGLYTEELSFLKELQNK